MKIATFSVNSVDGRLPRADYDVSAGATGIAG